MMPMDRSGPVNQKEVDRFLTVYPTLDSHTQEAFKGLYDIYVAGNVRYDIDMTYSTYNLRYPSHPQTNLSEALAFNSLTKLFPTHQISLVTSKEGQKLGHDIFVEGEDDLDSHMISVKMAWIPPDRPQEKMRSFSVHNSIKRSIMKEDTSDIIVFVDNINGHKVFCATDIAKVGLKECFQQPGMPDRIMVFYDRIGLKGYVIDQYS